jgi:uncharacterized protein (UPF0335 family)
LIGDNKMSATVAAEFVRLLMEQVEKIENEWENTKGKD